MKTQQVLLFSRVHSAGVHTLHDGNQYAHISHRMVSDRGFSIRETKAPRLVRFAEPSFIRDGYAYVWFATMGVKAFADLKGNLPDGVMSLVVFDNNHQKEGV